MLLVAPLNVYIKDFIMTKTNNLDFEEYSQAAFIGAVAFLAFVLAISADTALEAKKERNIKPINKVSSHTRTKIIKKHSVGIERE